MVGGSFNGLITLLKEGNDMVPFVTCDSITERLLFVLKL